MKVQPSEVVGEKRVSCYDAPRFGRSSAHTNLQVTVMLGSEIKQDYTDILLSHPSNIYLW